MAEISYKDLRDKPIEVVAPPQETNFATLLKDVNSGITNFRAMIDEVKSLKETIGGKPKQQIQQQNIAQPTSPVMQNNPNPQGYPPPSTPKSLQQGVKKKDYQVMAELMFTKILSGLDFVISSEGDIKASKIITKLNENKEELITMWKTNLEKEEI
jgi:hypothetical protein